MANIMLGSLTFEVYHPSAQCGKIRPIKRASNEYYPKWSILEIKCAGNMKHI